MDEQPITRAEFDGLRKRVEQLEAERDREDELHRREGELIDADITADRSRRSG